MALLNDNIKNGQQCPNINNVCEMFTINIAVNIGPQFLCAHWVLNVVCFALLYKCGKLH
jgi:hypothetical protein